MRVGIPGPSRTWSRGIVVPTRAADLRPGDVLEIQSGKGWFNFDLASVAVAAGWVLLDGQLHVLRGMWPHRIRRRLNSLVLVRTTSTMRV